MLHNDQSELNSIIQFPDEFQNIDSELQMALGRAAYKLKDHKNAITFFNFSREGLDMKNEKR